MLLTHRRRGTYQTTEDGINGRVKAMIAPEIQSSAITATTTLSGTSPASSTAGRYVEKYSSSASMPREARIALGPVRDRSEQSQVDDGRAPAHDRRPSARTAPRITPTGRSQGARSAIGPGRRCFIRIA
jgi:hypothetical protein